MATQSLTSINKSKRSEFDSILTVWENRYKLRLLSTYLPRAIIVGLLISIVVGLVGYSQRLLMAQTLAVMVLAITGMSALLIVLYVQLFPRQRQVAARYFDVQFGLKERVSTALELMDGHIQTHPDIETMQISDALQTANRIDPKLDIEMDFRPREIFLLIVLAVGMLAMILVPLIVGQSELPENPSAAVRAAQDDVREITETIATDTDLEDVDRQELLDALEVALERLQEQDITDEEAFAAMSQLESQINEIENELQETLSMEQSSLEAAMEALGDFAPPPPTESEDGATNADEMPEGLPSMEDLQNALDQMSQDSSSFSEAEMQSAAEAMREAAQELANSNPELSDALQDAADAMESGDNQTMQEQMDSAQQQMQQQQQQMDQNSNAQQMLQDQSEMAQQAMQEISQQQSESQSQQSNSPSESSEESASESQSGNPQQGQPGEQQSENSQPGDTSNSQQPSRNQPGQVDSESSTESTDSSGEGAGDGESSNTALSGGGGEDQGAESDNNPTGEGQIEYEAIYNPTGADGGGNNEIELETDSSDQPVAEGDFDDNPFGQSQVSYDTVFSDYQDAANRALESDYVPLGLRDVVRDYFTSLEPSGNE